MACGVVHNPVSSIQAVIILLLAAAVGAQETIPLPPQAVPEVLPAPPATAARIIPTGTPLLLRAESAVSSKTAQNGDMFDISVAQDVMLDGQVVIPAGTKGKGEVVHAQSKGFGGRAGELLLAARHLDVQGRQLKLRGFAVVSLGADNTAEALGVSSAFWIAGLFVTGTSAEVQVGQVAQAKTAEPFELSPASPGLEAAPDMRK